MIRRLGRVSSAVGAVLRRLVTVPLVITLELLILATAPVTLAVAALLCLPARSSLPLRSVALVVAYAGIELSLLPRLITAEEPDWDALLRDLLDRAYRAMHRILDVAVEVQQGSTPEDALRGDGGVVVLARHCGPGDSLFIA